MDETLDWMDEFDDSVFTDTIEANDTSALAGFDNAETEAETSSSLEANETETEADNNISDDFFTNFTPTINFSMARAAGPSSMNNNASSKGDGPAKGPSPSSTPGKTPNDDMDLDDYYGGGKTDGDDPNDQGGFGSNWDGDDDDGVDLDDYYGGGKTDGDDDSDDDYGSWTDKDRAEAAKEIAEAAGNEAAAANAEVSEALQNIEKALKDYRKKSEAVKEISAKIEAAINGLNSGVGVGTEESKKAHEAMAEAANTYGKNSKEYKQAAAAAAAIDKKELESLQAERHKVVAVAKQAQDNYRSAANATDAARAKAKEALEKAQAANDKVGTLAGEAAEATKRAEEKQKEWEQKQKDALEAELGVTDVTVDTTTGNSGNDGTTTNKDSAINNTTTFDLAKTLADSGAKMTEKEYGQVADFVANHPELASIINGGLTNAEKHTIGNVIAGIQAINAGNYLTAAKEFAQGLGMTLVSAVQLIASGIYGAGARILGIIKSFMENPNVKYGSHNKDFETFEKMRAEYGDSSELQSLYDTAKGTTDQKQTFDYMKDNAATNVGEYNEGLVEDVNKVVSDASRKVIHYSPYVLEAVKKWR